MTNSKTALWTAALSAAAIGTWILYDAEPAINWGIWVATASLGLLTTRVSSRKSLPHPHTLVLLAWACILGFAQSITAVPAHTPLIVAAVAILLGLAVTTLDDSTDGINLVSVARVPFAAVARVGRQAGTELWQLPASARGIGNRPRLRAVLFALPIAVILLLLLSQADPILDSVRQYLLGWLDYWSLDGRVFLFAFLLVLTLGAFGLAAGQTAQRSAPMPDTGRPFTLARSDTRAILLTLNAMLWTFVTLQLFALTNNPAAVAGTGVTYAEYARRGFGELSVAAAFVLAVILVAEVFRGPDAGTAKPRLELAAVVAVELILASAFRRVFLYEAAYGFTTDRVIAQLFMLVLGCVFVLLALDLTRGALSAAFGRRGMIVVLTAVTAFIYWNHESWIVRRNLERASRGTELDVHYLTTLSPAAVPALITARASLPAGQRAQLDSALSCRKIQPARHWYEWNLRREQARAALRRLNLACKQPG